MVKMNEVLPGPPLPSAIVTSSTVNDGAVTVIGAQVCWLSTSAQAEPFELFVEVNVDVAIPDENGTGLADMVPFVALKTASGNGSIAAPP